MTVSSTSRLVGVYNANGGLFGELSYVIGKMRGTAHCALCNISHGNRPMPKKQFTEMVASLPLPFKAVHLNERDAATVRLMEKSGKPAPVVALIDDADPSNDRIIVDAEDMESCSSDPQALRDKIEQALD